MGSFNLKLYTTALVSRQQKMLPFLDRIGGSRRVSPNLLDSPLWAWEKVDVPDKVI